MGTKRQGFILLLALAILASLATIITTGLTRSMTELLAARYFVVRQMAFHLAEAGLDDALADHRLQGPLTPAQVNALLRLRGPDDQAGTADDGRLLACRPAPLPPPCPATGTYVVTIADNLEDDNDLTTDTDQGRVILTAVGTAGTAGAASETVQATVQLQMIRSAFMYAMAGTEINLDGTATIGTPVSLASLYLDASQGGVLLTSGSNELWASQVDFYNPNNRPPGDLCANCSDAGVFHPPVAFNWQALQLAPVRLDLEPYYQHAVSQQSVTEPYHYITTDTTLGTNVNNYTGVIYVECGVNITVAGSVTLRAVVVHEGCGGRLELASNTSLTMLGSAFAPGLAIIGAPSLKFNNTATADIAGFVMGLMDPTNKLMSDSVIEGGLVGTSPTIRGNNVLPLGVPGPGVAGPVTWPLSVVHIGGNSSVIFRPLPGSDPGLPEVDQQPEQLMWSN